MAKIKKTKYVKTDEIDKLMCQDSKCPARYHTVNVGAISIEGDGRLVVDDTCEFCGSTMDKFYKVKQVEVEEEEVITDMALPLLKGSSMRGKAYYERRSDKR